jgi:hypothetical protein
MQNLIGKQFGQYEITALIGSGGMGQVFRARDTRLKRDVALKVLPLDTAQNQEMVKRFVREANAAASLDHPNIIDVYNMDLQDGMYYIAMRLVEGETLETLIARDKALPPTRALQIAEQVADALAYAHQRQIIHRDIKPANVMLDANDRVTLMDFGIAKAPASEKLTRVGQVMGTIQYMSPEQFAGKAVDARTDVYALGVMVYEMLTGRTPFTTDVILSSPGIYDSPPSPRQYNPQIPPDVERVLLRCLARHTHERYATPTEFCTALRAAYGSGVASAPVPTGVGMRFKLVRPDGYEYPLQPGALRLGRAVDNDIVLTDERVSRHHLEIRTTPQGSAMMDLQSANGTFINGQRVPPNQPITLAPGMHLHFGPNTALLVQVGPVARPAPDFGLGGSAPPGTTKDGGAKPPARPTTILALAATRLTDGQLALVMAGLVVVAALAVWFGTPLLRRVRIIWYNLPLIALIGPLVYAALRRRWLTLAVHSSVALIGGWLLWQRVDYYEGTRYVQLALAALLSGAFMEGWVALLPRLKAARENAWPAAWLIEVVWLALMAMLGVAILYGLVDVGELARVGQWLGSALLGALGWFLGDMIHEYLTLRRTL